MSKLSRDLANRRVNMAALYSYRGAVLSPPQAPITMGAAIREAAPVSLYRYSLFRAQTLREHKRRVLWIMLNPSTADAKQDDPTIRRVLAFSNSFGFDFVEVVNLFAYRATDPAELRTCADPVGWENNTRIYEAARRAHTIICAWGNDGVMRGRATEVCNMLTKAGHASKLYALRINQSTGEPAHPLYIPSKAQLIHYPPGRP